MTTDDIPLPSPPFIEIPGLRNFRDAGGYPVSSFSSSSSHEQQQDQDPNQKQNQRQKIVRRGVLFRASEPSMVTPEGVRRMTEDLGIAKVYDLRSQTEIDRDAAQGGRHVREWAGAERVFAPVFGTEDYSPEAIARRFSSFSREGTEVCCFLLLLNALSYVSHFILFFTPSLAWKGQGGKGRGTVCSRCLGLFMGGGSV